MTVIAGNLVDWWEPESKRRYLEKAQCIIDQYGNYTVEVSVVLRIMKYIRNILVFRLVVKL